MFKLLLIFACLFIITFSFPLDLGADNFHSVMDGSKPGFIKFYAPWCGHCKRFAPDFEIVGKAFEKFKDRVVVAKVDCDQEANKGLCSEYGIQGFPTLNWFKRGDTKNPTKYSGGRTAEEVIKFINDNAGLNARVPGKEPSYVVDLTDDTFDSIVLDSKKDVFVEFYAPWCGHCKSLAPTYEKLGKVYANEDDIVIARIDADGNKGVASRFSISGFPTLKYFPKNNKKGEDYGAGRELNDLVVEINKKFGANRNAEGRLDETAGRISSLDTIVAKLAQGSSKDDVKNEVNEALSSIPSSESKTSKIYLAYVDKYTDSFVDGEISRLERMINSGSVAAKKIDDFTVRINILKAFK